MKLPSQNDESSDSGSELEPGEPSFVDDPPSYLKYKTFENQDSPESEVQQPHVDVKLQEPPVNPVAMTARAYQREMVEESLKRNIIVTVSGPQENEHMGIKLTWSTKMDTGSGKTQV